jgi:hypothetical protein
MVHSLLFGRMISFVASCLQFSEQKDPAVGGAAQLEASGNPPRHAPSCNNLLAIRINTERHVEHPWPDLANDTRLMLLLLHVFVDMVSSRSIASVLVLCVICYSAVISSLSYKMQFKQNM